MKTTNNNNIKIDDIKINDIIKLKNGKYYKLIRKGTWVNYFKNLETSKVIPLDLIDIETVYNKEEEKNVIMNRILEKKLEKLEIDTKKFANSSEKERREIIDDEKILLSEKIELLKYDPVRINQAELKTTIGVAATKMVEALKDLDKKDKEINQLLSRFKT